MLSPWQWLLIGAVSFILPLFIYLPMMFFGMKSLGAERRKKGSVAFFHPFTNDGGGGERVLWCAVRAIQEECPEAEVVIYTVDPATAESLAARALDKFGVKLLHTVEVIRLYRRSWIEAKSYSRLTILGQSLGSIVLAWEAFEKYMPEVFIDTSGYAFAYPLARLYGCRVVSYTHYPTISLDMLARVKSRSSLYNNNEAIARSGVLSAIKVQYYRVLACFYGLAGARAHVVMVNSSWTEGHINGIWGVPKRTFRVFPPCDTESLQALPLERSATGRYLVSVAQFRPEKDHALQLKSFAAALNRASGREVTSRESDFSVDWRLKLVGSSRHKDDEQRIEALRVLARELGISNRVDFHVNSTYAQLQKLLGGASAGLHTMLDEHFGIVVVEYMAAGAVPIAHRSGGPQADIVDPVPEVGLLARTVEEYAEAIHTVLTWSEAKRKSVAQAAREKAREFSGKRFSEDFKRAVYPVLPKVKGR